MERHMCCRPERSVVQLAVTEIIGQRCAVARCALDLEALSNYAGHPWDLLATTYALLEHDVQRMRADGIPAAPGPHRI